MYKIEEVSTLSTSNSSPSTSHKPEKPRNLASSKREKRPSASKKYPGQIMVGVARLALKLLQNSNNPLDREVINFISNHSLGKQKEDYKFNTVDKIRDFFIIKPKDDFLTQQIKFKFSLLVKIFFQKNNFENWVLKEFKGTEENKKWYLTNHEPLYDRIMLNKKTHFYLDAKSNPLLAGASTTNDKSYTSPSQTMHEKTDLLKEEEQFMIKKVKIEEPNIEKVHNIDCKCSCFVK